LTQYVCEMNLQYYVDAVFIVQKTIDNLINTVKHRILDGIVCYFADETFNSGNVIS